MRRLFATVLLCSSIGLFGATPTPITTPKPRPAPTVTPAPVATGKNPVVLIYPFQTPSDLDQRYGSAIANIYAQVFTDTGGLTVLAIPTNIKQEDYAKYAAVQHADYYISGYIEPIGDGASIISQIFDVNNDIGVTSQTTQIESVNDIGSQALNARTVILAREGIDRPELQIAQATPEPTSTSGASVSVNNVLGDLFRNHPKAAPKGKGTPAPTPTPEPPKPGRGIIATRLTGHSSASDLASTSDALTRALSAHYTTTSSTASVDDITKQADAICGKNRNNTIASGVLDTVHTGGYHPHDTYSFTLNVSTCFGASLYTTTEKGDNRMKAVQDAVDAYFGDHPDNS